MRERETKREVSIDVAVAAMLFYANAPPSRGNLSQEVDKICDKKNSTYLRSSTAIT